MLRIKAFLAGTKKIAGRRVTKTIHWDTIVCQLCGYWDGDHWIDS